MRYEISQRIKDALDSIPSEADRKTLESEMQFLQYSSDLHCQITLAAVDAIGVRYDDIVRTGQIPPEVAHACMTKMAEQALQDKYEEGKYDGEQGEQVLNADPDEPPEGWEPQPEDAAATDGILAQKD